MPFEITVDRMVEKLRQLFAFRWHPSAVEHSIDYSDEPTTLVVLALEDTANGILLTVIEFGFDRPAQMPGASLTFTESNHVQ